MNENSAVDYLERIDPGGQRAQALAMDLMADIAVYDLHPLVTLKALVWCLASVLSDCPETVAMPFSAALPGALAQMMRAAEDNPGKPQ